MLWPRKTFNTRRNGGANISQQYNLGLSVLQRLALGADVHEATGFYAQVQCAGLIYNTRVRHCHAGCQFIVSKMQANNSRTQLGSETIFLQANRSLLGASGGWQCLNAAAAGFGLVQKTLDNVY